eukprot:comp4551_c0_seq1/m.770 comp4551_c0_seq1/g.770  ORF comp4551_c0_seq1/g.770 comp4551_c0_seq1/m.770 type:complete len:209 (-) comp4551_c0_seq1:341-967(-)
MDLKATPSVTDAVHSFNTLDPSKLHLFLARIIQRLHLRDTPAFTSEEREKLSTSLCVPVHSTPNLVETCEYIFQEAAYKDATAKELADALTSISLATERTEVFCSVWESLREDLRQRLEQHSFHPRQLESVNWELRLQMATESRAQLNTPTGLLRFSCLDRGKELKGSSGSVDRPVSGLTIEVNQAQLFELFLSLEAIQQQLDELTQA